MGMTIRLKVINDESRLIIQSDELKIKSEATVIYQTDESQIYSGSYHVVPSVENDISLPTKSKVMNQNLTVAKVPQFEVSNESGGKTLIIGEEHYNG